MSELFATTFRCGDGAALVTYLYGESSPAEREAISAHVGRCVTCAEELSALGSTRQQIAAWAPPERTLGFQIAPSHAMANLVPADSSGATIPGPAAWWSRPLPAWAQMAAAVVIFASGMALGAAHSAPVSPPANTAVAASATTTAAPAAASREELAQVEQRLRGELAQLRTAATPDTTGAHESQAFLQRVSRMIAESEARQQKELDFRTSVLATDFANARTRDLVNIEKRLGSTSIKVLSNQQDINSLAQRVGYSPSYSPYVP